MEGTIYLIRHGRTALNAAGVLRGRIDEPLDDVGRAEANHLASVFAPVRLDRVISSPLKRSLETAQAIAAPHGIVVCVDAAFIDRDYGPWAGKAQQELVARYGSIDDAPEGEVEPRLQFVHRLVTAIERITSPANGENVVITAHDAVNRALIRALCGTWRDAVVEPPQPTGCWNRLVFDRQATVCEVVGAVPGDGSQP